MGGSRSSTWRGCGGFSPSPLAYEVIAIVGLASLRDVRESRRQDDPRLTQGEWETELKTAQWPEVRRLCENILQNRSKDLQIAGWYMEALTMLHGFQGLASVIKDDSTLNQLRELLDIPREA